MSGQTIRRRLRHAQWAAAAAAHPGARAVLTAGRGGLRDLADHRRAAIDWLLDAHRAVEGRGFSLGYFLDEGAWQPPYPETTGYILPTLLRFVTHDGHRAPEVLSAVDASAAWLVRIQDPDGSFRALTPSVPMVFDTGQIIFGLLAAHRHRGAGACLEAAARAGDWLLAVQDDDGAWRRHAYRDRPHVYYAEVAWALLLLARATGTAAYGHAAERHLSWVLSHQLPNAFFTQASFDDGPPVLHTIGYVLQGVYESGRLLGDDRLVAAARRTADALVDAHTRDRPLRAYYNDAWMPADRSRCLTGLAQVAIAWTRLFQQTGEDRYAGAARAAVDYLRRHQLSTSVPGLRGGLCGSAPAWGRYFPLRLPNWGAKFYLDVLLFAESGPGAEWTPVRHARPRMERPS